MYVAECLFAYLSDPPQVRYIIEASLMQAHLLNRTLVLPSFVYARSCEYDMQVTHASSKLSLAHTCAQ